MKMKAISLASFLFLCCLNPVSAQTDGGSTTTSNQIMYCDLALPALEQKLQTEADATCTTQSGCVECMDRTSNMTLAATLVVQPKNPSCKTVTDIEVATDAKSRGAGAIDDPVLFQPKIIQSPCFAGGTNLEVYVPGYDAAKREFAFLWTVDGRKAGHLSNIQCACGKTATVRVTYLPTGQSVTLKMKLNSTCGGGTGTNK